MQSAVEGFVDLSVPTTITYVSETPLCFHKKERNRNDLNMLLFGRIERKDRRGRGGGQTVASFLPTVVSTLFRTVRGVTAQRTLAMMRVRQVKAREQAQEEGNEAAGGLHNWTQGRV